MADYYFPTVIQPTIPEADMTPLERLVLTHIFGFEPDDDGLYFFAELAPDEQLVLPAKEIRAAIAASEGVASEIAAFVRASLPETADDEADVDLDLSATPWEFIFQDIVRRSSTPEHVTAVSAFTCTKMRPDGFGGMAVLITADGVRGKSTEGVINELLDEAEHGEIGVAPGFGVHVLLRLGEENVRAEIPQIIEADPALTAIASSEVTDADIRAGCIAVVERTDLTEEQGTVIFNAALAAIREAERRRKTAAA